MNKWKTVRNITLTILILFVVMIVALGIGFWSDTGTYPDPNGLTRLKSFEMVVAFIFVFAGIPMLADIIFLFISIIKIKRNSNQDK